MLQIQMLWAWTAAYKSAVPTEERDRGDGILVWVVVVAALVVIALAVVAIVGTKAKTAGNGIRTQ